MDSTKYIGMDVHKEATTIAVMNAAGKLCDFAVGATCQRTQANVNPWLASSRKGKHGSIRR